MQNYKEKNKLDKNNKNIRIKKGRYPIPLRDEFHRYYCGELTIDDFSTVAPASNIAGRIDKAIKWSKKSRDGKTTSIHNLNDGASTRAFIGTGQGFCTECQYYGFWDEGYQTLLDVFDIEYREGY